MNPHDERRPGFDRGRRHPWLLPLIVGIGLGALIFSLLPGMHRGFAGRGPGRQSGGVYGHADRRHVEPGTAESPSQPQAPARGEWKGHHGAGPGGGFGGLFFPFGGGRLLLPLLLIGTGAWLLSRRRPGPRANPPGTAPAEPARREDQDPPATGETRRL